MTFEIRTVPLPSAQQAISLFLSVKWGESSDYVPAKWEKALKNNSLVVTAWDNHDLVGMIRVLSDDINDTYITDLVVRPDRQRMGIGKELVSRVINAYPHTAIYVCGISAAEDFFEKCGFKKKSGVLAPLSMAPIC